MGTDRFEQRLDIQLADSVPRFRDLAFEQVVQAFCGPRWLAANGGRDIA